MLLRDKHKFFLTSKKYKKENEKVFFETIESGSLFCFGKMKENENPKKRFEQLSEQTKMFLTIKKEILYSHSFLRKRVFLYVENLDNRKEKILRKGEFFRTGVTKNGETRR